MRQLTYVKPRTLEWWDVPDPKIEGAGEAIVRPLAVSACDLDPMIVQGFAPYEAPIPLGHEFVAEVVETGESVQRFRPGDRVSVPFAISCGECERCRRGLTAVCASVPKTAMFGIGAAGGDYGGALSDLARVPYADHMLVPLPEGVAPTLAAAVSDNLVDGWRTVGPQLADRPGAAVLVMGGASSGTIGLYAVAAATALGAESVTYVDTHAARLEAARALGANAIEGPPPRRFASHPVTVDASADPTGLACVVRSTEPGGVCTSTGIYFTETPMPLFEMFVRNIEFRTGRPNVPSGMPEVLALLQERRLRADVVTAAVVPWDDAPDALVEHSVLKLVVERTD